jgi:hypothetical protein
MMSEGIVAFETESSEIEVVLESSRDEVTDTLIDDVGDTR